MDQCKHAPVILIDEQAGRLEIAGGSDLYKGGDFEIALRDLTHQEILSRPGKETAFLERHAQETRRFAQAPGVLVLADPLPAGLELPVEIIVEQNRWFRGGRGDWRRGFGWDRSWGCGWGECGGRGVRWSGGGK